MLNFIPREKKEWMTQEEAIAYHNSRNERMLSMADVWQLVKDKNIKAIKELREDWGGLRWSVLSTRIIYKPGNLSAEIIHNADSSVINPMKIKLKEVPICDPTYINELLSSAASLSYVRALICDSKATKQQIISGFEYLSGKDADGIRFWTPDSSSRKRKQVRAVRLYFGGGRFYVDGSGWFDDNIGLSRGVLSDSAKRSKKKSEKFTQEEIKESCKNDSIKAIAMMMYNKEYHKKG
jgi:hypothetical protein